MKVYFLLNRLADTWLEDKEAENELNKLGVFLTEEQKRDLLRIDVKEFMQKYNIQEVKEEATLNKEENLKKQSLKELFSVLDIENTVREFYEHLNKYGYGNLIYTPLRPRSIYEGEVIKELKINGIEFYFLQHKIKRSYSYGLVEKGVRDKIKKSMALVTWLHLYNKLSRDFIKAKYPNVEIDINTFLRHLLAMVYINMNKNIADYALILNNADYFILSHTPKSNLKFYVSNATLVLQEQTKLVMEINRILGK